MAAEWKTVGRHTDGNYRIFTVDRVHRRATRRDGTALEGEFVVLNSPSWINIIPLTAAGNVVMIRQFRHGISDCTVEVPGGLVDEGEEPLAAAMRECREETGYESVESPVLLGVNQPNPAFMNNRCFSYLWRTCVLTGEQRWDEHEDIDVIEIPLVQIPLLIRNGTLQHSLTLTAFLFLMMHEDYRDMLSL
jgi:8-oxo-dGTP pyrophosphatase MutT (NUDIX family)